MNLRNQYATFLERKQTGRKSESRAEADVLIAAYREHPDYEFVLWICDQCSHKLDHLIWKQIVLPELTGRIGDDPKAIKAMILTIQNLYSSKSDHQSLGYVTESQLTVRLLNLNPDHEWARTKRIEQLQRWLAYTIHEWPSGVLYGIDGASLEQCDEILSSANELRSLDRSGNSCDLCDDVERKTRIYKDRLANDSRRRTPALRCDECPDAAGL